MVVQYSNVKHAFWYVAMYSKVPVGLALHIHTLGAYVIAESG